ncbi:MAG: S41 family peptidase [Oscillospiraceae bacterium]|nr:S41 family peptidase [Oscillospiraceae bacterium]
MSEIPNKKKKLNKIIKEILIFFTIVVVTFILLQIMELYEDSFTRFQGVILNDYYSYSNLNSAMKDTLGEDSFEGNLREDFYRYVIRLVLDDINKQENEKVATYNQLFNKEKTKVISETLDNPSAETEYKNSEDFHYLKISDFTIGYTYDSILKCEDLFTQSKDLILDLQGNTGGYIQELNKVLGLFIADGEVTYTDKSDSEEKIYKAKSKQKIMFNKIYILTDNNTASCAEVMILALKSNLNVTLIGQKTYGKNFSYVYEKFNDGYSLALVSSVFCDKNGNTFPNGFEPDLPWQTSLDFSSAADIINENYKS